METLSICKPKVQGWGHQVINSIVHKFLYWSTQPFQGVGWKSTYHTLLDKTWFLTLTPCWKLASARPSHFAVTEQQLLKKTPERGTSSDGFGKQAEMMRTWRGTTGRSRCGQRRQEKLARRQSSAVYGEQAEMVSTPILRGFWGGGAEIARPDNAAPYCKGGHCETCFSGRISWCSLQVYVCCKEYYMSCTSNYSF